MDESAADYIKFLKENKRYKDVLEAKTVEEAIAAQAKTGYATDPNYGGKLADINARGQKGTLPSKPATQVVAAPPKQTKTTTASAPAPAPDPALAFEKARRETVEASQKQLDQLTKKSDIGSKKVTVTGNLIMGKPSGPIEYNGRTVKPEDSNYAEASKALVASMEKIDSATQRAREARASLARDSRNTMPQGEIVGTGDPAKISGVNGFRGMLTGPSSGYKPDLTMHGTEQLTIKPTTSAETRPGSIGTDQIMTQQLSKMDQLVQAFNNTSTQDMMAMQLDRLDELVRVMQNQVSVSTKILQQSR